MYKILPITHQHPSNDDIELMTANLHLLQRQITQNQDENHPSPHHQSSPNQSTSNQEHNYSQRNQIEVIREQYQHYLNQNRLPVNHQQKISHLIDAPISIGNATALFQMLYYFKQALTEEVKAEISQKALTALSQCLKPEQIRCYGQLIAECGVQSQQVCQLMAEWLIEERVQFQLAFLVLTNQGQMGLVYLYDIAHRQISGLSQRILDYLSRTETIIINIIIPTLLEDAISTNHPRHRDIALAAMNRLGSMIGSGFNLEKMAKLINDPAVDKKILISAIRSAGGLGEQVLFDIIGSKKYSQSIVALALSVLSWRVPSKPSLRLKAIEYTLQNCFLPGKLYQYQGQIEPWDFQNQHCGDSLCLSSRQFQTHLQLLLKQGSLILSEKPNNRELFQLVEVLQLEQIQQVQVSEQVIKMLSAELKNKSTKIKEIALLQLGNIGLPQAEKSTESVLKCLWDSDSTIRSAACWTVSRICQHPTKKLQNRLNQLLRDNFWKVRTSACISLGLLITNPQTSTIQGLIKVLQDGSIPKTTVCQALVRMGAEQLLLQILKGSSRNDFKLREAVIASFQYSSPQTPLLNTIVEQLLRYSRDSRIQTRQMCLITLNALRSKVDGESGLCLSYFSAKHLLPFYYCFLDDSSAKIRNIASMNILSFGSQAELIFIQGMTKGQPLAKIQCIRCLGQMGVQNFRAVILGLRDQDERVRKAACETILTNFSSDQIIQQFGNRQNHSISLICNLRQILGGTVKNKHLKELLLDVVLGLQQIRKTGSIRHYNQNTRINN